MEIKSFTTQLPLAFEQISLLDDSFEDRRDAIDLVANQRSRTLRVALFGHLILRPDPTLDGAEKRLKHQEQLAILDRQVHEMQTVRAILEGKYPADNIAPSLCQWVHKQAKLVPDTLKSASEMVKLSEDILHAAIDPSPQLSLALERHLEFGRSGYSNIVGAFYNQLWASVDQARSTETENARRSTKAVGEILSRLEHIGKHVRLVSLNASVEAARAGDAGRGLAVIAVEFKSLAEEIQTLATRAGDQMAKY